MRNDISASSCDLSARAVRLARASGAVFLLAAICEWGVGPLPEAWAADAGADYRIGAGDVLKVDVAGRPDLSGQFTVDANGAITFPTQGQVKASGRTAAELGSDISRRLSLTEREIPRVTVTVTDFRSRKVFVLGSVLLPGAYSFAELPTPWEAISEAGGPLEDSQLSAVEIIPADVSAGKTNRTVDVAAAIRDRKLDTMERLRPGDTVRVPRVTTSAAGTGNFVYVFGAVALQGARPYDRASDLVSALVNSGGPTPDANMSQVEIVRKTGTRQMHLKVDMRDYLGNANPTGNPALFPGDTVYLPRTAGRGPRFLSVVGVIGPLIGLATSVIVLTRR